MKSIAFFNNKGGVGKTSLVYHLAWMFAELGHKVLCADLDPQSNLTSMFLSEDRLMELWPDDGPRLSIYECVRPLDDQSGDIAPAHIEKIGEKIALIPGDLQLSSFEDKLSQEWLNSSEGKIGPLRVVSAFGRVIAAAAARHEASLVLIDVGPNLGAINRTALIASDCVVVPLASGLFSLQALQNLGPTLFGWRESWKGRLEKSALKEVVLPAGDMTPIGYVMTRHSERLDRPVKAYERWMAKMPNIYRQFVLRAATENVGVDDDPYCLGKLKDYRSLMAMAQEADKPMFALRPADGAIGSLQNAVAQCHKDFKALALKIKERAGIPDPA
jgi:chromosome partitioning protein